MKEFLPISQEDINARGWEQIDFCLSAAMPMLIILLWTGCYLSCIRSAGL